METPSLTPVDVPTHCRYARCQEGADGGPKPIDQTPGKRTRYYCCDAHRAAARQEAERRGRFAVLPTPVGRQVAYGDDVLAAHRDFRTGLEGLRSLAEQLAQSLAAAADVRAAQSLVDQAEAKFAALDRQRCEEINAEQRARISAWAEVAAAEEAAENAREETALARASQREAQAQLADARAEFERERAMVHGESEELRRVAEEAVRAANARADAAEAALEQTAGEAKAELARVRAAADASVLEARELAAQAKGAREAALSEVKLAHEDARRAREDIERVRSQLEEQLAQERQRGEASLEEVRKSAASRERSLERDLQDARDLAQQAREDARHAIAELTKQLEASARELAAVQARTDARVEEVRAGVHAQLVAAQQLAEERKQARDQIALQLANLERAEAKRRERVAQKKERPK